MHSPTPGPAVYGLTGYEPLCEASRGGSWIVFMINDKSQIIIINHESDPSQAYPIAGACGWRMRAAPTSLQVSRSTPVGFRVTEGFFVGLWPRIGLMDDLIGRKGLTKRGSVWMRAAPTSLQANLSSSLLLSSLELSDTKVYEP